MSTRNRVPPLLEPLIQLPPEASLLVLTGTVDINPHWLVSRFLGQLLGQSSAGRRSKDDDAGLSNEAEGGQEVGAVLVSWMRDYEFWKAEARRGAGIDLPRLAAANRFAFVDGLTDLFNARAGEEQTPSPPPPPQRSVPARSTIPQRSPAPSRAPAPTRPQPAAQLAAHPTPSPKPPSTSPAQSGVTALSCPSLAAATTTILKAIEKVKQHSSAVFLILDAPTLLLATQPELSPHALAAFVLGLRSKVHSCLLVVEGDGALLGAAATAGADGGGMGGAGGVAGGTALERKHAAFVVGQVHGARWWVGVRGLDTGVARDVSGVLAVRRGGGWEEEEVEEDGMGAEGRSGPVGDGRNEDGKEMEVLYRVGMDGSVKVFERGADEVG